jgi:hypothetical protein
VNGARYCVLYSTNPYGIYLIPKERALSLRGTARNGKA